MKTLAERLYWARTQKKMSQQELADAVKPMRQSTVANLENGLTGASRKIVQIADALGVDPHWLAEGTGEPYITYALFELQQAEAALCKAAQEVEDARTLIKKLICIQQTQCASSAAPDEIVLQPCAGVMHEKEGTLHETLPPDQTKDSA
ncbi:hypothetical protein BGZ92_000006 [Podila epicladia]|nr:hypothetical protein BGZ92_000006 [Podila epicladia]